MGVCICKKHGRSGIVVTCAHVAASLDAGRFGDFHLIQLMGHLLVCSDCLTTHGFDAFVDLPSALPSPANQGNFDADEAVLIAYEAACERLGTHKPFCSSCVDEIEFQQARRDGRPDPFPVYERTLTSLNQDLIDTLERRLLDRFKFRESIVQKKTCALEVYPGDYRRPLTLRTYYVVDPEDQRRIVDAVSSFLRDQQLNQARVQFWEAEAWTQTKVRGWRGAEKLLHSVDLNC